MLYHVVAVLLGGLSLAKSYHVHPTRKMSVAKPRLRMSIADGSSPAAVSSAVAIPGTEEKINWNKQVRCVTKACMLAEGLSSGG